MPSGDKVTAFLDRVRVGDGAAVRAALATAAAMLIVAGAAIDATDGRGRTPLMHAAKAEPNVLAGRDTLAADVAGMMDLAAILTVLRGQEKAAGRVAVSMIAKLLRDARAAGRTTADRAVVAAVEAGDADALTVALEAGGSPTATILTKNGTSMPVRVAAFREDGARFDLLIAAGASPDDGGPDGPPLPVVPRS